MTDVLLAPNLPKWMKDHVDRYLSSGGTDGHIDTVTPPGYSELHVTSLLLITKGRKSGQSSCSRCFTARRVAAIS